MGSWGAVHLVFPNELFFLICVHIHWPYSCHAVEPTQWLIYNFFLYRLWVLFSLCYDSFTNSILPFLLVSTVIMTALKTWDANSIGIVSFFLKMAYIFHFLTLPHNFILYLRHNEWVFWIFFLPQRRNIFYFSNEIAWFYSDWKLSLRSWFECCPRMCNLTWVARSQACSQESATDLGNIYMQLIFLTPCQSFVFRVSLRGFQCLCLI